LLNKFINLLELLDNMVRVDPKKCIGCGLCVSICPTVFEMQGSKAKVKAQKKDKCVDEAISSCPKSAISK